MRGVLRGSFLCCLLMLTGCALRADRLQQARSAFHGGDLVTADQLLVEQIERGGHDADVARLDQSLVKLASGQPREAEQLLRQVRDSFDFLQQTSAGEQAAAMVSDDNRASYSGTGYERVLIRTLLVLANLMHDGTDALAFSLQAAQEQKKQTPDAGSPGGGPASQAPPLAIAAYLEGMLREEMLHHQDDALRCYQLVASWEPAFSPVRADLERVRNGQHSRRGNGVLYVFTLVGRGPQKREAVEAPSTAALAIAQAILNQRDEGDLPTLVAPVKIPVVELAPDIVRTVQVKVGERFVGRTETITDVAKMAIRQQEAERDRTVARAVVRRVIKKGLVSAGQDAVSQDSNLAALALGIGGFVWEATESADTRCWGLLPAKIQVLRVELPEGVHQVTLATEGHDQSTHVQTPVDVRIRDGRNSYLLASFPDHRQAGTATTR